MQLSRLPFSLSRLAQCAGLIYSLAFTNSAQADDAITIAPIPNQVIYVGGPPVLVPVGVGVPPGGGAFNIRAINSRGVFQPRITTSRYGTNWAITITSPPVNQSTETTLGNETVWVSAVKPGTTNSLVKTSFILSVLPGEFTSSRSPSLPVLSSTLWADLDSNGFLDLVGISLTGTALTFERNNGSYLSLAGSLALGKTAPVSGLVTADYDGDGQLDLLLLGNSANPLFRNLTVKTSSSLSFPAMSNQPLALSVTNTAGAAWADLDGDGDLDLILTPTAAADLSPLAVQQFRNDSGGLTPITTTLPNSSGPVVAADFDGDGATDVLLFNTGSAHNTVLLLHNDGTGAFTDTGAIFPTGQVIAAGWTDFNGDGRPDVWLQFKVANESANPRPTTELALLQQTNGRFTEILRLPASVMRQASAPAWGDFDHDGAPDFIAPFNAPSFQISGGLLITTYAPQLTIWHNDGEGHFTPRGYVTSNSPTLEVIAGDANADGALDVAFSPGSGIGKDGTYFLNPNRPPNFPPSQPGGMQSFSFGTNLFFFWTEATDPNQTAPLTYNLRVGSSPGGNDIVASMSLTDGTRQVVAPGNCGFSTYRTVKLPTANFDALYWSVQAVDNSFVGGPFGPEQKLELNLPGNLPPVIAGLSNLVIMEDSSLNVRFRVTDDRTKPGNIALQVQTSNTNLFQNSSLRLDYRDGGNPPSDLTQHSLLISPPAMRHGEAEVTLIATDRAGSSETNTFHVTVLHVNHRPSIQVPRILTLLPGQSLLSQLVGVSDPDGDPLTLSYHELEGGEVALTNATFSGEGPNRYFSAIPASSNLGRTHLELTVNDSHGGTASAKVDLVFQNSALARITTLPAAGLWPTQKLWADLDGDGTLELVIGGDEGNGVSIYQWQAGQFAQVATVGPTNAPSSILDAGDFNNDGLIDLLIRTAIPNSGNQLGASVYLNRGNFHFEHLADPMPISDGGATRFVDLDGDGKLDVLSSGEIGVSQTWHVSGRYQRGDTLLGAEVLFSGSQSTYNYRPFDLDGDGLAELSGTSGPILRRNGAHYDRYYLVGDGYWILAQADFNFDQEPDLLLINGSEFGLALYRNLNDKEYSPATTLGLGVLTDDSIVADFDQDGRPDVLKGGGALWVATGGVKPTETPTFTRLPTPTDLTQAKLPAAGDFDGDGVMDLAISGVDVNVPANIIFQGASTRTNHPPTAPTNLRATPLDPSSMRFEWNTATDPEQSGGLTYNLRVGTAPGLGDVVSAESRADGHRLLPRNGNAGWLLHHDVRGLITGQTLYWSVQAVDSGFAGGPFAEEGSFKLHAFPTITAGDNQLLHTDLDDQYPPTTVDFTVVPGESPLERLRYSVLSLDATLIGADDLHLEAKDATLHLSIAPKCCRSGTAIIEVRAEDEFGGRATRRISVTLDRTTTFGAVFRPSYEVNGVKPVKVVLDTFDVNHAYSGYRLRSGPMHGTLVGIPPFVTYQAEAGFVGVDRFSFIAQSASGSLADIQVTLSVLPGQGAPRPNLDPPIVTASGEMSARFRIPVGTTAQLEESDDLIHWRAVSLTAPLPPGESMQALPSTSDGGAMRFYRLRQLE